MIRKFSFGDLRSSYWGKVMMVSLVLFFVYLGDGILSDWVPAYIQESMGDSLMMGFIISFSSVVGFLADLIFPQLLKKVDTKKMIVLAIIASLIFCGILFWSTWWPAVILFLGAMAVWGVYYEFLGFGSQQFVSESIPPHARAGAWALLGSFRGLAYFLGPLLGSYLALSVGNTIVVTVAAVMVVIGYMFWLLTGGKTQKISLDENENRANIFIEAKHWWSLLKHVWPAVTISLTLSILDATFWTTGTVFSDNLARGHAWGGWFLPLYELPMVFVGVIVARWGVYKGKKKLAEIFMLVTSILLMSMWFKESVFVVLTVSFLVGVMTSFSWPLRDAIYSDVVNRMGFEGKHMIGLSGSTVSLAYIVGPILAGGIANVVGERMTFVWTGFGMMVVSILLLLLTPKKMRLPQDEIQKWE